MKLIFFFILRRFFVKLRVENEFIVLEKKLFVTVKTVLYRAKIVRVQTRRTPIMRVLGAKEVTLFTQGGKTRFYLRGNEKCDLLPKRGKSVIKPRFCEVLFGAFIDARALAGITFFAVAVNKIGKILGENYLDGVIRALFTTAENVTEALAIAHIVIPKAAVFIGITALSAWLIGFLRKLIALSRFEVGKTGGAVAVRSGIVTLYENELVLNSAVISRETFISVLTARKTLYCRNVMILPCADSRRCERFLRSYFAMKPNGATPIKSPLRAFFGHCAVPMWALAIFSGLFLLLFVSGNGGALLLRSVFAAGVLISAYLVALYAMYMNRENHVFSPDFTAISCKKAAALYTAYIPRGLSPKTVNSERVFAPRGYAVSSVLSQSAFQRLSGLCDLKITLPERSSFRARLVPLAELYRC